MKNFEYRTLKTSSCDEDAQDELTRELSELGKEGWEVIQILPLNYRRNVDSSPSDILIAYLKRERQG